MPGNTHENNIIFGIVTKWDNSDKLLPGMTEIECGGYADRQDLSVAFDHFVNINGASTHLTIVFNVFVIYTLFNQINCRVINDSFNIFIRIHKNFFFPLITICELSLQVILMQFGKEAFKVTERGLTWDQWGICIGFSSLTFILSIVIKVIPLDEYIQKILDSSSKDNKVANMNDLLLSNSNMRLIEKNEVSVFGNNKNVENIEFRDNNNQEIKIKKEGSGISRGRRASISVSRGGSMRQKKADINFTHQ